MFAATEVSRIATERNEARRDAKQKEQPLELPLRREKDLERQLEAEREVRKEMQQSLSWRVTEPLRAFSLKLRTKLSERRVNAAPPVLILIPAYGSAEKLRACLRQPGSSICRKGGCSTYVLDDATPDDSVGEACEEAQKNFPELHYVRSASKSRIRGHV